MDFRAIPTIKFEIEGIKSQILAHLGVYGSELGEVLNKEIENAVKNYDYQAVVNKIVQEAITKEITSYFRDGKGYEVIKECVEASFKRIGLL